MNGNSHAPAGNRIRNAVSGNGIPLDEQSGFLRLHAGEINLFIEHLMDGRRNSLLFLCTLTEGMLVPSASRMPAGNGEYRLLAIPVGDAEIHRTDSEEIRAEELDTWCEALASGLIPQEGSGANALQFSMETELEVPAGGCLRSAGGVFWAEVISGAVCPEGFPETLKQETGKLVFFNQRNSLTAAEQSELRLRRTAGLSPEYRNRALADFHILVMRMMLCQRNAQTTARIENERYDEAGCEKELKRKLSLLNRLTGAVREQTVVRTSSDPLIAALQTIAADHRLPFNLSPAGHTELPVLTRLSLLAAENRWRIRRVSLPEKFCRFFAGTLLGFHGSGHTPAVLRLRGYHSSWIDPDGKEYPLTAEAAKQFQPVAYRFYEQFPAGTMTRKTLAQFALAGFPKLGRRILLLGICCGLLGLVMPVATEYITGHIIPTANTPELWQMTVLLLSLIFSATLLGLAPQFSLLAYGIHQTERFQAALFDHLLNARINFFRKFNTGELCTRLSAAVRIQETVFTVLSGQFLGSLFALTSLLMLFVYSWRLALLSLFVILIYCLIMNALFQWNRRPLAEAAEADGRLAGMLKQFIEGIAKIRGAGAEKRIISRCLDDYLTLLNADYATGQNGTRIALLGIIFPSAMAILFFIFAGNVWRGAMTLPEFLAFLCAYGSFQQGVTGVFSGIWRLASIRPEIDRLMPLIEAEPERGRAQQPGRLNGNLEISNVTFRYTPDKPPVLRNVSIKAEAGEFIAIVGPSGAGKSSLVRLLLGFEQPETGTVFYNGRDLANLDVHAVRRQLGVILQNSRIMPGTILDNILTGTGRSSADAERAAQLAALDRDLQEMPMGLFTPVSEGLISGGQQQKILIARALVDNPAIIIMDESTNALDNAAQEQIRRNMERLPVTRIVIAHRLSTVMNADRIYVMNRGRIEQSGTCHELMAQNGLFRELAERQLLNRETCPT